MKNIEPEKLALLDDLSSSCQQAYYLKLIAASNNLSKEVDEIEGQIQNLQNQIDSLRQRLSTQWQKQILEIHDNIVRNKANLEDIVAELRREINVIENIAKGIDYFQRIVEMAARIAI
jgi:predicted  nucleic acid-binding Zn-ribbon protein